MAKSSTAEPAVADRDAAVLRPDAAASGRRLRGCQRRQRRDAPFASLTLVTGLCCHPCNCARWLLRPAARYRRLRSLAFIEGKRSMNKIVLAGASCALALGSIALAQTTSQSGTTGSGTTATGTGTTT